MAANFPGDISVDGIIYARGVVPNTATPTGGITNALISATADIDATKMEHQHQHCVPISNHGSAPAAVRKTVCRVRGLTGTLVRVEAGVVQPLTVGSVSVDVYKNGTTVMSGGPIALTTSAGSGGTAYDVVAGTLTTTTLAQNDVLEVVVTVSGPTGGGGCFVQVTTREDAA